MARFYGEVGFGTTVEKARGVWVDEIVEYPYQGDIPQNHQAVSNGISVNDDISVGISISIVADAYAREHINAMRYVRWQGELWKIMSVEVARPRLLLRLGGVWNGSKD